MKTSITAAASVICGFVAVPISVGYAVAASCHTALDAILASCASGLVNIDKATAPPAPLRSLRRVERKGGDRVGARETGETIHEKMASGLFAAVVCNTGLGSRNR